jgi:hypothetical protein
LVAALTVRNEELERIVVAQAARIAELERRMGADSSSTAYRWLLLTSRPTTLC